MNRRKMISIISYRELLQVSLELRLAVLDVLTSRKRKLRHVFDVWISCKDKTLETDQNFGSDAPTEASEWLGNGLKTKTERQGRAT